MQAKRYGEMADTIRKLCARRIGCSLREAADAIERPLNVTSVYVVNLVKTGSAFKSGIHGEYRYFRNQKDAEAHEVKAKQERLKRTAEREKRVKEYHAKRHRDNRARIRAEKGLPTYEDEMKAKQKKMLDMTPKKSGIVISNRDGELQNKKAHIAAKIVWPEHVKVQVVPGYRGDTRFQFTPEPGWRGAITEDWINRRMAA